VKTGAHSQGEIDLPFLQQRVSLLARVLLVIQLAGLAMSAVETPPGESTYVWFGLSVATTLLWAGLALACRGPVRSAAFYQAGEAICLLGTAVAFGAMSRLLGTSMIVGGPDVGTWQSDAAGHYEGVTRIYWATAHLYGLALYCVLRAALVPSRPGRTLALTLLVGMPLAFFAVVPSLPWEPPTSAAIPPNYAVIGVTNVVMQWMFAAAVCTVLSKVLFGLRRDLRKAMKLGQYTLEAKIGEGAMGAVYRASHAMMRRPTAIKLLSDTSASSAALARFEREVQETARLTHANTITIFDYGRTPAGVFYYVMEMLDGATANAVVELAGPMPPPRVVHILEGVCGSLEEAHGAGLMHRDVKPANIVLCSQGGRPDVPKLLDFGLVKQIEGGDDVELTMAGAIAGTPAFMAPETITRPEDVDARTDLYSLGAVGYFLLTGSNVFEGPTVVEICGHHLHSEPEPPSERLGSPLPEALEELILDCLQKDPDKRPQSATEVARRLEQCDVEPWTVHDARQWWDEYGPDLTAESKAAETPVVDETVEAAL